MKSALRAVFAFFSLAFCSFAWSTDFYWVGKDSDSGNWSKQDNWSLSEDGTVPAGSYPQNDDTAIFSSEATITTGASCGSIISSTSLIFQKTLTATSSITVSSGDLTVSDALSTGGKVEISSGNLSVGKGFSYSGDVNVSGDVKVRTAGIAKNNAKITAGGKITFSLGFNGSEISCGGALYIGKTGDYKIIINGAVDAESAQFVAPVRLDSGCTSVSTAGTQVFGGAVLLGDDVTFTASSVNFNSTLNSNASGSEKSVVINGDAVFGGSVGESVPLNSLTVNGESSVPEETKQITVITLNDQNYNGDCGLGYWSTFESKSGSIYFGSEVSPASVTSLNGNNVSFSVTTYPESDNNKTCFYGGFKQKIQGLNVYGNAEIYGSNEFSRLSICLSKSEKSNWQPYSATVKFESGKWQTIENISSEKPSDNAGSYSITLTSTSDEKWYACFSSAPAESNFYYTVIKNSRSVKSSGSTELNSLGLTPDSSKITDFDLDNPTTEGWFNFPDTYYWLGGASSSWDNAANWSNDGETALSSGDSPDFSGGKSKIIIAKGESSSQSPFILKLESDIKIKSLSVDSGAEIDFSGAGVEADTITNNGTVVIGKNQTISGDFTNNSLVRIGGNPSFTAAKNGSGSTVEYFGGTSDSPIGFSWDGNSAESGKNYENLIISGVVSSSDEISVGGETLITGGADFSGNCSFSGAVTFGSSSEKAGDISMTGANTFSSGLKIVSAGDISMTGANTFSDEVEIVSAGAVLLNAKTAFSVSAGASCGSLEILSDAKFLGGVLTSGAQKYSGAASFLDGAALSAGSTVTFESSVSVFGDFSDSSSTGTLTVDCGANTAAFSGVFSGSLVLKSPAAFLKSNSFGNFFVEISSEISADSLSCLEVSFAGGETQSVGGTLKCAGTSATSVLLKSSNSSKWIYNGSASSSNFSYTFIDNSSSKTALNLESSESTICDYGEKNLGARSTEKWFKSLAVLGKLSFSLSLAPVGSNYIYLVYPEKILYGGKSLQELKSVGNLDEALESIKSELKIMDKSASSELFEISEVEYKGGNENFTALLLTVGEKIALDDIPKSYLIFNGTEKHIISDFAVNAVKPLYACTKSSSSANGSSESESNSDIGTFSIHDFGEDSGNYGKLPSGKDVVLQVSYAGENADDETSGLKLLASLKSSVKSSMKSDKINSLLGVSWRVWIPEDFEAVSSAANTEILAELSPESVSSSGSGNLWNFTFENEDSDSDSLGLKAGDEVQFVFRIGNTKIDHGDGTETYLYSYWIPEENILRKDFSLLDLWSFSLRNFTKQRSGVSILKNVINLNENEQSVIEVDMKSSGNLNVFIMTLDGNIVRRLSKGRREAGTHFFKWNGTNLSGKSVARGLYFVRVVGPEIDETRKIMCVKK
ncbi:MAG: FlgD immunoglobulin-like domain containing protein [Treponema sp.]|nr:FlgD immunoglobulin-like domain containing protein [Treponema sp.]